MNKAAYRDEIRLRLTGGLLELEVDDSILDRVIDASLRELQRYICFPNLISIPYERCIDLSELRDRDGNQVKISSVIGIYRTVGYTGDVVNGAYPSDPMYMAQWQMLSGSGNMYNFRDYLNNYMSWNTLLQIRNTTSTDLAYRYDKATNKLYVNSSSGIPDNITVEYIPRYDSVEEINSDYWIDVLMRLAVALTKITVGRIRTRYVQSNALWTQDGQTILDEGKLELEDLRQHLLKNSDLMLPVD